ncbi:MAG TPA: hypothetical protein VNW92_29000 [Polyangiaceae bacterium]|jgi:hypothetical protein|nr:hypothetical protein [Polyangiaceae bacterium]
MSWAVRALPVLALAAMSCSPADTGGQVISFHAYASGVDATNSVVEFDTSSGFHVRLSQASLHIGAVYLRLGQTNPGSANASCVGDTTYGLQVPGPVDVDVLSSSPQEFSVLGSATNDLDQSGEVWLTYGDINQVASVAPNGGPPVIVAVAGVATKDAATYPFQGSLTIGQNHLIPPPNSAQPGQNPICKQRIVSPIPLSVHPAVGGDLLLRIDPRPWFNGVDFTTLLPGPSGTTLEIPDSSNGSGPDAAAGRAFFTAVTGASADVYRFSWFTP